MAFDELPRRQQPQQQYRLNGNNVRDAVTLEAAARVPQDWRPNDPPQTLDRVGLNVSEPLSRSLASYYDRPTARANSSNNSADPQTNAPGFGQSSMRADAYPDFANPNAPAFSPLDDGSRPPLSNWIDLNSGDQRLIQENPNDTNSPRVVEPGTEADWCTAYLQRLADPEKPWNSVHNPYNTVDRIPIDITVISGEVRSDRPPLASARSQDNL